MRWYRGRHLLVGAGIAAVAGAGAGFLAGAWHGREPLPVAAPAAAVVAGPIPVQFRAGAGSVANDEANNIEIYQRYNEGVVNITALVPEYHCFLNAVPRSGSGAG